MCTAALHLYFMWLFTRVTEVTNFLSTSTVPKLISDLSKNWNCLSDIKRELKQRKKPNSSLKNEKRKITERRLQSALTSAKASAKSLERSITGRSLASTIRTFTFPGMIHVILLLNYRSNLKSPMQLWIRHFFRENVSSGNELQIQGGKTYEQRNCDWDGGNLERYRW